LNGYGKRALIGDCVTLILWMVAMTFSAVGVYMRYLTGSKLLEPSVILTVSTTGIVVLQMCFMWDKYKPKKERGYGKA
jgi:hypothetical protein